MKSNLKIHNYDTIYIAEAVQDRHNDFKDGPFGTAVNNKCGKLRCEVKQQKLVRIFKIKMWFSHHNNNYKIYNNNYIISFLESSKINRGR